MRRLRCTSCNHIYLHDQAGLPSCPVCGSGTHQDVTETGGSRDWWNSTGTWIAFLVLVLMIVVLFLLPHPTRTYRVTLSIDTSQTALTIQVERNDTLLPSDSFSYSLDDGGQWQEKNSFTGLSAGKFMPAVKHRTREDARFRYDFDRPVELNPVIREDPCDCKKLAVTVVRAQLMDGKPALVIGSSQRDCGLQFSVSGKDGKFGSDSIFFIPKKQNLDIWLKSEKCPPVAYSGNPYAYEPAKPQPKVQEPAPAPAPAPAGPTIDRVKLAREMAAVVKKGNEREIDNFIYKYFAAGASVKDLNDNIEYSIDSYLSGMRLETWGYTISSIKQDRKGKILRMEVYGNKLE